MKYFYLLFLILLLGNCTPKEQSQGTVVDFGAFTKISDNQLLEQYRFVKLETNESCLLGAIDQIEVFANKIYILDSYQTKSIYVSNRRCASSRCCTGQTSAKPRAGRSRLARSGSGSLFI